MSKRIIMFNKLINKLFVGNRFQRDGFNYFFMSSSIDDYEGLTIEVNVTTEKKGQSYFKGVFESEVKEMISKYTPFVGNNFYTLHLFINGMTCEHVFINEEDKKNIFEDLSKKNEINLFSNNISLNAKIAFKKPFFYSSDRDGPLIQLSYDIYDIKVNGEKLGVNFGKDITKLSRLGYFINEKLLDSDRFRDDVSDAVIGVLEPSMKVLDCGNNYYTILYYIDKIDGINLLDGLEGSVFNFNYDLFI